MCAINHMLQRSWALLINNLINMVIASLCV